MQALHPSSSGNKANTPPTLESSSLKARRPLLATAFIGAALIGYMIHKTPDNRQRLESMAVLAHTLGDLSDGDAAIVAELLAKP